MSSPPTTLEPAPTLPVSFTTRGWVLFGVMGAIWGVPYLFIKVAVEHMSPPVIVFGRSFIAAVPLMVVALRSGAVRPALAHWRPLLAFAIIEMAIPWVLLTNAERDLPSGLTGLLIACVPMFGAISAYLLGDRTALHPIRIVGIVVGMCGVALLVLADLGGDGIPWLAVVQVLLVCVGYATAPFIAARRLASVPPVGIAAVSLSVVSVIYAPFAWATWPEVPPPAEAWAALVALGLLCTAVAFVLFFKLIAEVGPARATLITFVNPAVAVIVGAVVLDEPITAATIAGFVLVIVGCALATRRPAIRS